MREHIGLVVVDSVGLACGGEPEKAESIIRYFAALRSLRIASLSVDHVAKNGDGSTPFGSVYKINLARNVWEVRASRPDDDEKLNIGLYHRKVNQGKLRTAIGVEVLFYEGTVSTNSIDVKTDTELVKALTLRVRIEQSLKTGGLSVPELAGLLEVKQDLVRNTLNRNRKSFVKIGDNKWGLLSKGL